MANHKPRLPKVVRRYTPAWRIFQMRSIRLACRALANCSNVFCAEGAKCEQILCKTKTCWSFQARKSPTHSFLMRRHFCGQEVFMPIALAPCWRYCTQGLRSYTSCAPNALNNIYIHQSCETSGTFGKKRQIKAKAEWLIIIVLPPPILCTSALAKLAGFKKGLVDSSVLLHYLCRCR